MPGASDTSSLDAFEALRDQALGCTRCRLAEGRTQVVWDAEIAVHWDELSGDPPDLSAILGQLASPARVALKELGKTDPLPAQKLVLGQPLTLVSEKAPGERLSTLYLKPN